MTMKDMAARIVENRRIAENTYRLILETPEVSGVGHGIRRPGQFVNLKLEGFFLRRPLSVCDWDEGRLTLIYKTVGRGTEALAGYQPGRRLELLTPLGNGFEVDESGDAPVVIGGGAGVPPLYGLCKRLKAQGKEPVVILGFNTGAESFYEEEFRALGVRVEILTADGSAGTRGLVTDALPRLEVPYFYACGPEGMLRALDQKIDPRAGGQMSFEERMGCGFGACMGCSCKTKYGSKRICKEGPVLERGEILW